MANTKFQLAILADRHQALQKSEGEVAIEWLICKQRDGRWLDFQDDHGLVSTIDLDNPVFDLPLLLGVLVVGNTNAFSDVEQRWMQALPSAGVSFKRLPKWNDEAFLWAAIERLVDDVTSQRRQAGRAALDLATYRGEFERVQRNFSRLEEYIGRHSFQRSMEIFEYSPDVAVAKGARHTRKLEGVTASSARLLVQTLPVDSLGVSGLSLYILARPDGNDDALKVKLKAVETGRVYSEWLLRADDAQPGWVELALDHAIDEVGRGLALEVEWPSKTSAWVLALGPPHPYEEFCAEADGRGYLPAPLGVRLRAALPGVKVTTTTNAIRPTGVSQPLTAFVSEEVYAATEQVAPLPVEGQINLVSYDREINCLTVHPRVGGLAVARLRVLPPTNAWRLSAKIHLAHEQANPTEFALLVGSTHDENKDLARLDLLSALSPTFSGWITLGPSESRSISVVFADAPRESLSVYLLTRQAPGISPDFSWARFSDLEFNLLKGQTIRESPTVLPRKSAAAPVDAGAEVRSPQL